MNNLDTLTGKTDDPDNHSSQPGRPPDMYPGK